MFRKNGKRLQVVPHKLFHHLDELLKWTRGEYFPPIHVEIGTTYRCNHECRWCYTAYLRERKRLELDRETLLKVMKDMGAAGVKSCCFQGCGEPFMNPHTAEAIRVGSMSGVDVSAVTNGVLFTSQRAGECLPYLHWLRFSALEADARMYAFVHGCPEGQYRRLLENIRAATRLRDSIGHPELVVSAMMVVVDYNWRTVPEVTRIARELGLDHIMIRAASSSAWNRSMWEPDLDKKHADVIAKAMEHDSDDFVVSIRWDSFEAENKGSFPKQFDRCYGVEFQTMVDADACVYPCLHFWGVEEYRIGDLRKNTFEEVWRSERKREVLEKLHTRHDLDRCHQVCKQSFFNKTLWELKDVPLHVNFV